MNADSGRTRSPRKKEIGIALLLLVGISAVLYYMLFSDTAADKDRLRVEILQERHTSGDELAEVASKVPSSGTEGEELSTDTEEDSTQVNEVSDTTDQSGANDSSNNVGTDSESKEYLVVHSFGVASNAVKFANKLERHGYEVKTAVRNNGWTAVGVLFDPVVVDERGLLDALSVEYQAKPIRWEELESSQ